MLTAEMIEEFKARGGKVTKLDAGASAGITEKQWGNLVRGRGEPVEVEPLIVAHQTRQPVRIRAGHGII